MSTLDYSDRNSIETIVTESERRVRREFNDAIGKTQRDADLNQQQVARALTDIARALRDLTGEIKGLRADLNPELDKPVKLAFPKTQGGP